MNESIIPGCQFASDNTAGVCPEAWQALEAANADYSKPYGDDPWTAKTADLIREIFETDCEIFFTFNGTAANSLALASMCQSYHSVICSAVAHVETDECGGPEFYSNGSKLLLAEAESGKIKKDSLIELVQRRNDLHYPKPHVLSLTQSTELGTVYTVDEVRNLTSTAHGLGLRVHMDGARFANAVASLAVAPKEITWQSGVDVLCLGGTKNGLPVGDMVVFFNKEIAHEFEYRCKQAGQLASKMRYLAAGWVGILEDGAWLRHAQHANTCAMRLERQLSSIPEVEIAFPRHANAIFFTMPEAARRKLAEQGWVFYNFIGCGDGRLMCSWRTNAAEIDALTMAIQEACGAS